MDHNWMRQQLLGIVLRSRRQAVALTPCRERKDITAAAGTIEKKGDDQRAEKASESVQAGVCVHQGTL